MSKLKLYYKKLSDDAWDVKTELEFRYKKDRVIFILEIIENEEKEKVFTLIIEYPNKDFDIYIFDNHWCVNEIIGLDFETMYLSEFKSYREAYKFAMDCKKSNNLY